MSNSTLATLQIISPNKSSRTVDGKTYGIDTITIHCMAVNWTSKRCGEYFASSDVQASSNYGIGYDGDIALYVPETHRAWSTSNRLNDARAVTIEVACDAKHPYAVSDKAYTALIALVADICKRNGIKKLIWSTNKDDRINHKNGCNMTVHRDYANKACPGEYLYSNMGEIAKAVNKKLEVKPVAKFKDIAESGYKADIEWAASLGIAKGFEDGTFKPNEPCTRGQMCAFLHRLYNAIKEDK